MAESIPLITVHLGAGFPVHAYDQLAQARLLDPEGEIFLCLSKEAEPDEGRLRALGVRRVRLERIAKCANHRSFSWRNRLDRRSLGGFWLHTSERFFALESFMEAAGIDEALHLENDVMPYASRSRLAPAFRTACPGVGLTMDADDRCVPGLVYFRNREALSRMNAFVVERTLKRAKNDMRALALFMREAPQGAVAALPVIPPEYRGVRPLVNLEGGRGTMPWFDQAFEAFGGIFDAAALGQFLGGIDPMHHNGGQPGFISETAVYDPRELGLYWGEEDGLRLPRGRVSGRDFPVFCLHIHSKRLSDFSSAPRRDR